MIFRYPVNYVAIIRKFIEDKHYGLDLGWNRNYGGKNQPIYASADGVVYSIKDNDKTGKSWGNYVKIKHDDKTYTLYAHLKDGIKVKVGDKVKMGDLLGYMGTTGKSNGNHLHFEIYVGGSSTKYRVDPLPLTYVFPDQIASQGETKDIVKYYYPITEPVERDKTKNQLKILKSTLRVRQEPNLDSLVLGYATKDAIYDDLAVLEEGGYKWHKIAENNYVAEVEGYVELLPKVEPIQPSEPKEDKNMLIKIVNIIFEFILNLLKKK